VTGGGCGCVGSCEVGRAGDCDCKSNDTSGWVWEEVEGGDAAGCSCACEDRPMWPELLAPRPKRTEEGTSEREDSVPASASTSADEDLGGAVGCETPFWCVVEGPGAPF
jgi:hypothetical protein